MDDAQTFLVEFSKQYPAVKRVLLYGSRARGDAQDRSDFDVAIEAPGMTHQDWARFALEIQEKFPSLCRLDLLSLKPDTPEALRRRIQNEGIVLYERAA